MALINETTKKWIYLITYNTVSFLLWTFLTLRTVRVLALGPDTDEYDDAAAGSLYRQLPFPLLALTQTLAFLEVAHAALGLVGASAATTALQIGGKNLVVSLELFFLSSCCTSSCVYRVWMHVLVPGMAGTQAPACVTWGLLFHCTCIHSPEELPKK